MHLGPVGRGVLAAGSAAAAAFEAKVQVALGDCTIQCSIVPCSTAFHPSISGLCTNDVCTDAGLDSLLVDAAVVHVRRALEAEITEAVGQMPPWTPDVMSGAQPSAAGYYNANWAATRYVR